MPLKRRSHSNVRSTYKLESGEWATDVDGTIYTGGMDFYVAEDMEVTFIKVK